MIYKKSNERGYTLIEALISILILSLGMLPSLYIIILANNFSARIKNNLIATNLAQEGVEIVRAIRDENWFNGRNFDTGLANGSYYATWDSAALTSSTGTPPLLRVDSAGVYNYTTGTDTFFRRRLIITKIDPTGCNCEIRVVSEVSWPDRGGSTRLINIESHLFNWR